VDVVHQEKPLYLDYSKEMETYTQKLCLIAPKLRYRGIIRGHIELDSVINTDGWRGYDGLVDIGFDKHLRVNHGNNEFACGERHINGIESFWGYAKKRLVKFNGIDKKMFYLHLKETEYRFNHRNGNLYLDLLKLLRNNPL
jgi:transposase-like protein